MSDVNELNQNAGYEGHANVALDPIIELFSALFKSVPHINAALDTALDTALDAFDADYPNNDEWTQSPVAVDLERTVIQRKVGIDEESGIAAWIDTGFALGHDSIEQIREDFPYETYRVVIVTDETVEGDEVDDPYAEETDDDATYFELLEANGELTQEISDLKESYLVLEANVHNHLAALEEVKRLFGEALSGRNETGAALGKVDSLVLGGLDLNVTSLKDVVSTISEIVYDLPLIYNTNSKQFNDVAKALEVKGRFNTEATSPENLPDGELF
jgi:hypothetical protein